MNSRIKNNYISFIFINNYKIMREKLKNSNDALNRNIIKSIYR